MNFRETYSLIEKAKYYVFSLDDLKVFYGKKNRSSLGKLIYRWARKGWIYRLKKGLYELTYPGDFSVPDLYIANRLYGPSYVSLETALSHYSIIPEVSMAVTSITTKPTRKFKNKHGLFMYHTVKPSAFYGYYVLSVNGFDVRIAEPEKALVDYIYFKTYRGAQLGLQDIRMDKRIVSRLDRKKIFNYAKLYALNMEKLHAEL